MYAQLKKCYLILYLMYDKVLLCMFNRKSVILSYLVFNLHMIINYYAHFKCL